MAKVWSVEEVRELRARALVGSVRRREEEVAALTRDIHQLRSIVACSLSSRGQNPRKTQICLALVPIVCVTALVCRERAVEEDRRAREVLGEQKRVVEQVVLLSLYL